jgi:DNA polymerase-3 subunit gamma/tau
LQFRLLPAKALEEHVRWVVNDAKLKVSPEAIRQVVEQGGGSARDTLSALELVAAGGGEAEAFVRPEDIIESLINRDAASVLTQVGAAMQRGLDPKAFTEQIVRFLREMFLSSMAPQLVQLSEEHAKAAADMTARYGIASVVRAIEVLGEALLDIRRAPDPRLVLEVTLVRLASNTVANDTASLLARLERLELGSTRPRDVTGPIPRPRLTGATNTSPAPAQPSRKSQVVPTERPASPSTKGHVPAPQTQSASVEPVDDLVAAWPSIVRTLKATVRALYSAVEVVGLEGDTLVVAAPSEMHKRKCVELQEAVRTALTSAAGRAISLEILVAAPRQPATVSAATPGTASRSATNDEVDLEDDSNDFEGAESVVDQIAKSFPGARIVDTKK